MHVQVGDGRACSTSWPRRLKQRVASSVNHARKNLRELGGDNSLRLVLGGMLADLSAEHYSWVASGGEENPDAATVQARAEAFLSRLRALFDDAMALTLPQTCTGVMLEFSEDLCATRLSFAIWRI